MLLSAHTVLRPLSSLPTCLRRTIFSFPNLPNLPLPGLGSSSQTYNEERVLPYSAREMYAVVADVASYPHFIPFCTGSRIDGSALQRAMQAKTVVEAELTVGFMAFKESYVSTVTSVPFASVQAVASSTTPLFKALSTTWKFRSAAPSSTQPPSVNEGSSGTQELADSPAPTLVQFDLTYGFANPLHAGVSSAFFGKVSGMMIEAFENRCRTIYGPR